MPNILFDVGDWSSDGHGFSAEFIISSNLSLNELKSAHLKENEFIGGLCSEYEEAGIRLPLLYQFFLKYMPKESALNQLRELSELSQVEIEVDLADSAEEIDTIIEGQVAKVEGLIGMLEIWLMLLKVIEPSFEYTFLTPLMSKAYIKYKGYPVGYDGIFHYYGFLKSVHLKNSGYGVRYSEASLESNNEV